MVIICTYLSCFNEGNQIKSLCIYVPVLIQVSMMNTVTVLAFHMNVYVVRSKELGPDRLFCIGPFYCCGISSFSQFKVCCQRKSRRHVLIELVYLHSTPVYVFKHRGINQHEQQRCSYAAAVVGCVLRNLRFVDRRLQVLNLYQGWVWVMGLLSG